MTSAAMILAGGLSRRMGGGDKTLTPLGGKPILAHIIDRLCGQVDHLALNANGDPSRLASFELKIVPDSIPDFPGPLAGVLAAMEWAAALGLQGVTTVSCDTPLLPTDLVSQLQDAADGDDVIAVAHSASGRHPVVARWPTELAGDLRLALVEHGLRRVNSFIEAHPFVQVDFEDVSTANGPVDPFANMNTPDDLAMLQRIFDDGAHDT